MNVWALFEAAIAFFCVSMYYSYRGNRAHLPMPEYFRRMEYSVQGMGLMLTTLALLYLFGALK